MNCVLLLTGTIVPNVSDRLIVSDPAERKEQYIVAIRWYLSHTSYKIVFCENSGNDISKNFSSQEKSKLEILTFKAPTIVDNNQDRGTAEMEILAYALSHSLWLKTADLIIKGTGRLILKNVNILLDIIGNRRNFIATWMMGGVLYADSRYFFCSKNWLEYFVGHKNLVTKSCNFENTMGIVIKKGIENGHFSFFQPWLRPRIDGIGGGSGLNYYSPFWKWVLSSIRMFPLSLAYNLGYFPQQKV